MIRTECPICGSKDKKHLFQRDFSCMKEIIPFVRYTVFQCDKCGALYAGDIVESMPLSKYYDICSKYSNENYNITSGTQNRFNRIADLFERMIPKSSSVLDIGCSEGFLLKTLRDKGYTDVSGIEPSTQCVNFARKQLHLNVVAGGLGDMDVLNGNRYDVIISEQVMEHIKAPVEAVLEMKEYLKPEGILCIGVPDVLTYQNDIDLFQQFSSEHVNYFSVGSIENLMRESGFEKVDIIENPDSRTLISFWKLSQADTAEYEPIYDTEGIKAINNYLDVNKIYAEDLKKRADLFELNKAKYNVWGAGTYTAMLIQLGIINPSEVEDVIDGNRNYQGHTVFGKKIVSAADLSNDYPILLSVSTSARESVNREMHRLGLVNKVIELERIGVR